MFCQNSSLWPDHLGWAHVVWLIVLLSYANPFILTSLWSMKGNRFTNRAQIQTARNFTGMTGQHLTQDMSGWPGTADSLGRWLPSYLTNLGRYCIQVIIAQPKMTAGWNTGKSVWVTIWWYQSILLSSPLPLPYFLPLICHGSRNQLTKLVINRTVLQIRVSINTEVTELHSKKCWCWRWWHFSVITEKEKPLKIIWSLSKVYTNLHT